jgi:hypothetical protein
LGIESVIEFLMRKRTFFISIILAVIVLYWASFVFSLFTGYRLIEWAVNSTERVIFVENADLESAPGVRVLDANNPLFQVLRMDSNRIDVKWKQTIINLEEPRCRVKKLDSELVHVTAQLNDKQYPLLIDSGCGVELVVNDMIVIDNNLEIFPFETADSTFAGFCRVHKIEIGDMTITTPPCLYTLNHYEKRVLGRTKWKQRQIIVGLGLLCKFRYFLIDNISSEVEFGMRKSFAPDPDESWLKYPMSLETDEKNMRQVVVEIPIAGRVRRVAFDTGASNNLLMAQSIWEKFSGELEVVEASQGRIRMFYGWEQAEMNTVGELDIGERTLSNAAIAVLSDESKKGSGFFLLGMGCFKDTVIVLDFERNLLWVRKPQSS